MTPTLRPGRLARLICEFDTPVAPAHVVEESRALLEQAGVGVETLRLFRVTPCVAFGPKDERAPGYARAIEAARTAGFEPAPRVEGGRAVAADVGTLGIAWTIPGSDGRARIRPRFSLLAALLAQALRELDVDARVGAVAGEYCPGDFSVNARGEVKLVGLGQRVTARAVHLGAFVVVDGAPRLRAVLSEVYTALGLDWAPRSLGSVVEEVGVAVTVAAVAERVIAAFERHLEFSTATQRLGAA